MKLNITYPFTIKQVSEHTVEVEIKTMDRPLVVMSTLEAMTPHLGHAEQDRLAEDIHDFAVTEAIKRSCIVQRAPKA